MKKIILLMFFVFRITFMFSQIERFDSTININDLERHIRTLASDDFEGRETFSIGQQKAAKFISDFLKINDVGYCQNMNSYYQKFGVKELKSNKIQIQFSGKTFNNFDEIIYHGKLESVNKKNDSLVFIGRGSKDELTGLNLQNKSVLLYGTAYLEKIIRLRDSLKYNVIFYIPCFSQQEYLKDLHQNIRFYRSACNVNRFVSNDFEINDLFNSKSTEMIDNRVFIFQISPGIGSELLGLTTDSIDNLIDNNQIGYEKIYKKIHAKLISYQIDIEGTEKATANIIGFFKGTENPEKCLILTAHYDHLGKNDSSIFHGADDNASGVAALMEIVEAFSIARKYGYNPKISLLFLFTSGEELGLWGSKYFINSSIFKKTDAIANINIDMIGRIDPKHINNNGYLYVMGDSIISESILRFFDNSNFDNNCIKTEALYLSKGNWDLKNSDHNSFLVNNIPAVELTSGIHSDYHKPSDTYDKISYNILKERVKLIYKIICEIINAS